MNWMNTFLRLLCFAFLSAMLLAACSERPGEYDTTGDIRTPQRIVCASPALAEIAAYLGAEDRIVGVSDYTTWPETLREKPSIGGVLNPNVERILTLKPDLLLLQGNAEILFEFAKTHSIPVLRTPLSTLAEIEAAILNVAHRLGDPLALEQAEEWQMKMQTLQHRAASPGIRVIWLMGHTPGSLQGLTTAGAGTFINECIQLAGGKNIFQDVTSAWPPISLESIMHRPFDILLDSQPDGPSNTQRAQIVDDWKSVGIPPEKVRVVTNDFQLIPGPRVLDSIAVLSSHLSSRP